MVQVLFWLPTIVTLVPKIPHLGAGMEIGFSSKFMLSSFGFGTSFVNQLAWLLLQPNPTWSDGDEDLFFDDIGEGSEVGQAPGLTGWASTQPFH